MSGKKVEILPGDRFHNLTIIREVDRMLVGREKRRAVEVICDCGNTFTVRHNALVTGNTRSCGCMGIKYITPKNRQIALDVVLRDKTFKRVSNEDINDGFYKVSFYCQECQGTFKRDFNSAIKGVAGCPLCPRNGNLEWEEEHLSRVHEALKSTSLYFVSKCLDTPLKYSDNVLLCCRDCSTTIKRRVSVISDHKLDCPCKTKYGFNVSKQSQLYLLELVSNDGRDVCYKYGISNCFDKRLPIIARHFDGVVRLWCVWDYEDGVLAQSHERVFKKSLPTLLSKEALNDGWTETFDAQFLTTFLAVQTAQFGGV